MFSSKLAIFCEIMVSHESYNLFIDIQIPLNLPYYVELGGSIHCIALTLRSSWKIYGVLI